MWWTMHCTDCGFDHCHDESCEHAREMRKYHNPPIRILWNTLFFVGVAVTAALIGGYCW